jgi:hypothetical protein
VRTLRCVRRSLGSGGYARARRHWSARAALQARWLSLVAPHVCRRAVANAECTHALLVRVRHVYTIRRNEMGLALGAGWPNVHITRGRACAQVWRQGSARSLPTFPRQEPVIYDRRLLDFSEAPHKGSRVIIHRSTPEYSRIIDRGYIYIDLISTCTAVPYRTYRPQHTDTPYRGPDRAQTTPSVDRHTSGEPGPRSAATVAYVIEDLIYTHTYVILHTRLSLCSRLLFP